MFGGLFKKSAQVKERTFGDIQEDIWWWQFEMFYNRYPRYNYAECCAKLKELYKEQWVLMGEPELIRNPTPYTPFNTTFRGIDYTPYVYYDKTG